MIIRKIFLAVSAICAASSLLKAQQNSYSLYSLSPLFTNPASITMQPQAQATISHRSIFIGPNERMSLSSVGFLNPLKLPKKNTGAADVNVFTERTGPHGIFQQTGILAGGAYDLKISTFQKLTFGLQAGILFRSINENKVTTDNQYGSGGYDPSLPTGETINNWKTTSFTFNTGLNWKLFDKIKPTPRNGKEASPVAWAGIAFFNLNRPTTSLYSDEKRMPIRTVVSGGYSFRQGQYELTPSGRIILEASSYQVNAGAMMMFRLANGNFDFKKVGAGFWLSSSKTVTFFLPLVHTKFLVAFGYDIPFKKGIEGNGMNGAAEMHFSWKF